MHAEPAFKKCLRISTHAKCAQKNFLRILMLQNACGACGNKILAHAKSALQSHNFSNFLQQTKILRVKI